MGFQPKLKQIIKESFIYFTEIRINSLCFMILRFNILKLLEKKHCQTLILFKMFQRSKHIC